MRNMILIVDDEELNREILRAIFEPTHEIVTACDGREAIEQLRAHHDELAAVLLDIVMPNVTGYQVLQTLHARNDTQVFPIILITANTDSDVALRCYSIGAAEIISKPFVAAVVRQRVMNMIEMYATREQLKNQLDLSEQKLSERERQLEEFNDNFVDTISNMVEFRDMESGQHVKRVKGLTQILAETYAEFYPESGLTPQRIRQIVKAAALHDIGKIAIPDTILLKPGRLTPEERKIMEEHTTRGCEILAMLENVQDKEHYAEAYEIVRHHHERYDGGGYPDKLKGDEIPISAALVSLADVYDALTSERIYKKAYSKEKSYNMIMEGACGAFGPKLIRCFEHSREAMELFIDSVSEQEKGTA